MDYFGMGVMLSAIGGYFELELPRGEHFHPEARRLNSATNSLEYVLRVRAYNKLYIPYYTCEALLAPLEKLGVEYEFYPITLRMEPVVEPTLRDGEAFLYTNYFGLKQDCVERLAVRYGRRLIVDNAQAFYAPPVAKGVDTFYSPRKFFGVPDGAYLYTDSYLEGLECDESHDRMSHLLKRIDLGAERGYEDFGNNSEQLAATPLRLMSRLTGRILCSVDYRAVAQQRRENYLRLHEALAASNSLSLPLLGKAVPMVYPYLPAAATPKERLRVAKVFVATYWPNVLRWCKEGSVEHTLASRATFLPIDQRYARAEMDRIIEIINS